MGAAALRVTHSCFAAVEPARELLDRGADPDAFFTNEYGRMSALYGAAGRVHDPELTRLLLERGANPDDGESLYHATEAARPDCVRVLLEHGASIEGTNALAHALDEDRFEHVRLLLEAGADPAAEAYVAHAVRRGRGPDVLRLLVEHGADVDRPGGETWRGEVPLRTPYPDVDVQEVLILTALFEHPGLVIDLVGPGFRGVVGGSPEGSLLHHAAWVGDARLVRLLLERGADADGPLYEWLAARRPTGA
jgi:ankyrin repeat protein